MVSPELKYRPVQLPRQVPGPLASAPRHPYNAAMTALPAADSQRAERQRAASAWAAEKLRNAALGIQPLAGDASFRRYFRVVDGPRSLILMDAPPDREDSAPFIDIAQRLRRAGLRAPRVLHFDLEKGFGLLEDFGDTLYRDVLDDRSIDAHMPDLLDLLEGLACRVQPDGLPDYDEQRLQDELDLFTDWYLARHRRHAMNDEARRAWQALCDDLVASARAQPQVFVHRDFHSCNLMHTPDGPGLIDFQDGVRGPLSYDLASLLWDRYIPWPRERLENWMEQARRRIAPGTDAEEWVRQVDWMGLQRNLKIVGIFARLRYRDGKEGYVEMIPRFYRYLLDVLPRYPRFADFRRFLEQAECAP